MKKILPLLLTLVMVFSATCLSAIAADNAVEISAATNVEAKSVAGTTIAVPVSIDKNPGLVVGRVTVTWDETALKLDSVTFGDGLGQDNNSAKEGEDLNDDGEPDAGIVNDGSYPVSFGSYLPDPPENWTGTGELFVLNFVVLEGADVGEYTIGLSGDQSAFLDNDINEHSVGFTDGAVTLYNEITAVAVDIIAPVKGAEPQTSVTGTGYTGTVTWSPEVDSTFAPATEYTASIELTAENGYKFADAVTATINGGSVTATVSEGKVSMSKDFGKTTHNEVSSAVLNIATPVNGEAPQSEVAGGIGYTCSDITWSPDVDTAFGANKVYTAEVTLTATAGYKFAEGFTAKVGNSDASVTKASDTSYTVQFTFGATAKNQISAVALSITAPVKGAEPQKIITAGEGYTGTISWNGDPTKFAASTVYTATVVLTPSADYEFVANAAATVNGEDATESLAEGKLTVTYEFPTTSSKETQPVNCNDFGATYGDAPVTLVVTGAKTALSYEVTFGEDIVSVSDSGVVTFLKVGYAEITITAAEDENYLSATTTMHLDVAAAGYSYAMTADTQFVKAGSGLSAIAVAPATGSGVNSEAVAGTLNWFTDADCTNAAVDTDLNTLASGGKVTLYWSFTATNSNYVSTAKSGSVEFTAYVIGDVNLDGRVTDKDAMILARYKAGWSGYDEKILCVLAADVNGDGYILDRDASILARHLAGWGGIYDTYFN